MDKGYIDFQRLYRLHQQRAFFVIRAKDNLVFSRCESRPVSKNHGVHSDQTIRLTGPKSSTYYPKPLRRIHYVDVERNQRFFFLTNNFILSPATIARLYQFRRQIELFFKWIKQHLHIKSFYGTDRQCRQNPNLDRHQCLCAGCHREKGLDLEASLYEILQVLSITLFEKTELKNLFSLEIHNFTKHNFRYQLVVFDL